MNTVSVRIKPLEGGKPTKGAKVQLKGQGIDLKSTVGTMFAVFSPADNLRGKLVMVLVNGKPFGSVTVPVATETGVATIPIETATLATSAVPPPPTAQPTHEEKPEQHPPKEAHTDDQKSRRGFWPFRRRREVQPEAVEPDAEKFVGEEEQVPRRPVPLGNIIKLLLVGVLIAGLVFLGFKAPQGTIALDIPSAKQTGVGIITWFSLTAGLCVTVLAIADRMHRRQVQDIIAALIALVLFQVAGADILRGLFSNALGEFGIQAILFTASMLILYAFGIAGTPDFTTPGTFWLVNVGIALITGKFGPFTDWVNLDGKLYTINGLIQGLEVVDPKFTILVISMVVLAVLHFLLDISGWLIKGEDPNEKWGSLALAVLLVGAYYLVSGLNWLQPIPALIVITAVGALLAEFGRISVGVLFSEQDVLKGPAGRAMIRTKWDGAALGVSVVLLIGLVFGYIGPVAA